MKRHEPAPANGWWWVRLSPATPRGADRRWMIARVLDGAVQPHGTSAWYSPTAEWLRGAEWVPVDPPPDDLTGHVIVTDGTVRRGLVAVEHGEQVRRVAAEVVDVFVGASDGLAAYYYRHPEHRDELVAVVTRLILKAAR